jgi:hypothetical protein
MRLDSGTPDFKHSFEIAMAGKPRNLPGFRRHAGAAISDDGGP